MRESTSRPKRSVPSGWLALGGANICAAATAVGEYGATASARAPARMISPSIAQALTKSGLRAARPSPTRSATSEPRVERRVEQIDAEIEQHEDPAEQQDHALDDGIVALEDRVEQQPADTGQREDVLDHDNAADDVAELDAGHGDDGDERVAQRVAERHLALGQALGSRGTHVLAAEH